MKWDSTINARHGAIDYHKYGAGDACTNPVRKFGNGSSHWLSIGSHQIETPSPLWLLRVKNTLVKSSKFMKNLEGEKKVKIKYYHKMLSAVN